jgi:Ca-activated chloride channel homolog
MKYFDFQHITFAHPQFFWLVILIPFLIYWQYFEQEKKQSSLAVTTKQHLSNSGKSFRTSLRAILPIFRILAILFLIIALARPQSSKVNETINNEGLDIVLSLDISGSMLAQDFNPNRIEAAKKVAGDFILNRPTDRIGLVIFSGESFTQKRIT